MTQSMEENTLKDDAVTTPTTCDASDSPVQKELLQTDELHIRHKESVVFRDFILFLGARFFGGTRKGILHCY